MADAEMAPKKAKIETSVVKNAAANGTSQIETDYLKSKSEVNASDTTIISTNSETSTASEQSEINENPENEVKNCAFWLPRKKRYCRMTVAKGRAYCGEHEPASADPADATDSNRIPCPLDGKHTIYKKNLKKHLKICNARPRADLPAYIVPGINAGDADATLEDFHKLKLHELSDDEFFGIVKKVKELFEKYVDGKIITLPSVETPLPEWANVDELGKESKKHAIQIAALLGKLEADEQLQSRTSFVEFGAGKGQLAFHLAQRLQQQQAEQSQVVLLDRMSLRHKKDNRIEDRSLVQRIRADIADFDMQQLDLLRSTARIVALSKHLCGAATDLTLRCIAQSPDGCTEYVLIAVCCHHRCDWTAFVGKEFCRSEQLTPREFVIITKMASWAICGTGLSRSQRDAQSQQSTPAEPQQQQQQRLPLAERERVGYMCKRVLDYARLEYLRARGYAAQLVYYVPQEVTLENVCLVARKLKSQ